MPEKLYQEYRALISGCRAIFTDLRDAGIDVLPLPPKHMPIATSVAAAIQAAPVAVNSASAEERLADIQQEVANCQSCALKAQGTQAGCGTGNLNARLMLVAEADGGDDGDENQQEQPFVGQAGQLLDRILFAMKMAREDVYICHMIKCKLAQNRAPEQVEIDACESFLQRQLIDIAPEIILSLGSFATQTLLQTAEPFSKLRGRWQSYRGIQLMPTFHPADLLQHPAGKHQVWEDVKQVIHRLQESAG